MKRGLVLLFLVLALLLGGCCRDECVPQEINESNYIPQDNSIEAENVGDFGTDVPDDMWGAKRENVAIAAGEGEWQYRAIGRFACYDTIVTYYFNEVGLYCCEHLIADSSDKKTKFNTVDEFITEKYGDAKNEFYYSGDQKELLQTESFEEVCIQNGFVQKVWRLTDTMIYLEMEADGSVYVRMASLREVK